MLVARLLNRELGVGCSLAKQGLGVGCSLAKQGVGCWLLAC